MKSGPLYAYVLVASVLFAVIAVLAHASPFFYFDLPATQFLQSHRSPGLDVAMKAVSWPGYAPQFLLMFVPILAAFFLLRLRLAGVIMAAALLAVGVIGFAIKPVVGRRRPPGSLVWVNDHLVKDPFTFTAGHAHTYVVIYGWIIFLAVTRLRGRPLLRLALVALSLAIMLLTGFSRVYLGDHWTSDVLAGYLLGSIWLAIEILAYLRFAGGRGSARKCSQAIATAGP